MDLNELVVFARVVQAGSFTTAAAQLGMPKSTVSRKVTELEDRLEARLLQRTTRKLSLTDAGRTYYDYAARIVSEMEDAERAVTSLQQTPRGLLRVTAPLSASFLAPALSEFMKRYPEVQLELQCTSRVVDLVEERFDVGLRMGTLADSSLIARGIGAIRFAFAAAPSYLKKRGRPKAIEQLKLHDVLLFGERDAPLRLVNAEGAEEVVELKPRMRVMDIDVLRAAANDGIGVALLPIYVSIADLREKRLDRVLRGWSAPIVQAHIVYPSNRNVSPKVKAFVEHLQQAMSPPPWELGPLP